MCGRNGWLWSIRGFARLLDGFDRLQRPLERRRDSRLLESSAAAAAGGAEVSLPSITFRGAIAISILCFLFFWGFILWLQSFDFGIDFMNDFCVGK